MSPRQHFSQVGFHELMHELLRFMQIQPSSNLPSEVYSFSFDDGKTEVNIFSEHPGRLDMLVLAGVMKEPTVVVLRNLLGMNPYIQGDFPLGIGVDPASGKVTLWTRHSLEELDVRKLASLLTTVLDHAATVQGHLNASPAPSGPRATRRQQIFNW